MRDAAAALGGPGQPVPVAEAVARTPADTTDLARQLAPRLAAGDCLCLAGDLGAGKTTFVAGLVEALGGEGPVLSPTFTLENRYALPAPAARPMPPRANAAAPLWVSHFDLYRPDGQLEPELLAMMWEARDSGALLCVEWAEAVQSELAPCLRLEISLLASRPSARRLHLTAIGGPRPPAAGLAAAWGPTYGGSP